MSLRSCMLVVGAFMAGVGLAQAGQASGSVAVETMGTISPTQAVAYVVRNSRNARATRVELLLSDVPVDAAEIQAALDPHVVAINLDPLEDRNYVLLWVSPDGTVSMNATFSKTMTQMINDTNGGLKAELTTNTPSRVEGRVFTPKPVTTLDGTSYSVDLKFKADVRRPAGGQVLPGDGGDPGKGFIALLSAVDRRDWPAIRAASGPAALKMFEKSYNTDAQNTENTSRLIHGWLPDSKRKVTGGQLRGDTAILEVECEVYDGQMGLSLVQMVKAGGVWQFERSIPMGMLP